MTRAIVVIAVVVAEAALTAAFGLLLVAPAMATGLRPFADMRNGPGMRPIATQGVTEPAPSIAITVPGASPEAASSTPETVSGTSTGDVASCAWSTSPASNGGACSIGVDTFSCPVSADVGDAATQTVTVTCMGPGGSGVDDTVLVFPALQMRPSTSGSGWSKAGDAVTINGTPMTLVASCDEADVSGTTMTCTTASGTMSFVQTGGGASAYPTLDQHAYFSDGTQGMSFISGGKYPGRAARTLVNGTDYLIEVLFQPSPTSNRALIANATSIGAPGFSLTTTTTSVTARINDGSTSATPTVSTTGAALRFNLAHAWIDDDTNIGVCNNGTCAAAASIAALVDWSSVQDELALGSFAASSTTYASRIYGWRIWSCAGCLHGANNAVDVAAVARLRTSQVFGTGPLLAADGGVPSLARASDATFDVIRDVGGVRTKNVWAVGFHAPRVVVRGAGGNLVTGYLSEAQATNLALQSQTLGTTWTAITGGDNVLADQSAGPILNEGNTVDCVDGNNSDSEHGLRQSITHTAATHTTSAWFGAGTRTRVVLRDNTVANARANFNLSTCFACDVDDGDCAAAVGTVGAGVSQARAQNWPIDSDGDGDKDVDLCRVSITYVGTVAAHDIDLLGAEADDDFVYADADALADFCAWGVEVEAFPMMTTYNVTTTAAATRSGDDLRFGPTNYVGSPSTLDSAILCPNAALAVAGDASIGVSGNEGIFHQHSQSGQVARSAGLVASVTQWAINSVGDASDGLPHSQRTTAVTNDIETFYDGVSQGTDTSATITTSPTAIYVGSTVALASTQSGCVITDLRLWPRDVTPTEAP
jgi:hypothetical protein